MKKVSEAARQFTASLAISRRDALRVGATAAALAVVASCASFRKSDLDKANRDLSRALDELAQGAAQEGKLASIARRIGNRSRELVEEHEEFEERFIALSNDRSVPEDELDSLNSEFSERRTQHRDELLRLQDELRGELTAEQWGEAVKVLNETQTATARPLASEK